MTNLSDSQWTFMTQSSVKQHNIDFLLVRTHFKTNMAEYKIEYYVLSEYGSDSVKKYTTMDLSIKPVKFGFNYHKKKLPGCRFIGLYSLICEEFLPTGYY